AMKWRRAPSLRLSGGSRSRAAVSMATTRAMERLRGRLGSRPGTQRENYSPTPPRESDPVNDNLVPPRSGTPPPEKIYLPPRPLREEGASLGMSVMDSIADFKADIPILPRCAISCREQVQQKSALEGSPHSITSSARASTDAGMSRPRALAVLRLMTMS